MDFIDENVLPVIVVLLALSIATGTVLGLLYLLHFVLTLPMRRAERARLFLDIIEVALDSGQPVEEGLIFISHRRGNVLGGPFAALAECLRGSLRLSEAIATVPHLLPQQISAMLKDAVSQTRGATNYAVAMAFVVTPVLLALFGMISIKVLPAFQQISTGMAIEQSAGLEFLTAHRVAFALMLATPMLLTWFAAFLYVCGPYAGEWLPALHRVSFRLPARRKRMQRDFSVMLAILLDAGMPEPQAVTLAAECTANTVFRARAASTAAALERGVSLTEAVDAMDDAGEFRWRLANACHAHGGFLKALAGWHEALDAKAFQLEQASAHAITTALVLFNGLFVGFIVTTVFAVLVSIINTGILW